MALPPSARSPPLGLFRWPHGATVRERGRDLVTHRASQPLRGADGMRLTGRSRGRAHPEAPRPLRGPPPPRSRREFSAAACQSGVKALNILSLSVCTCEMGSEGGGNRGVGRSVQRGAQRTGGPGNGRRRGCRLLPAPSRAPVPGSVPQACCPPRPGSGSVCAAWVCRGQSGEPGLGPELVGCGSGRLGAAAGVGPGRADAPCPILSPESKPGLVGWIVVRGCVINSKNGRLRRN